MKYTQKARKNVYITETAPVPGPEVVKGRDLVFHIYLRSSRLCEQSMHDNILVNTKIFNFSTVNLYL